MLIALNRPPSVLIYAAALQVMARFKVPLGTANDALRRKHCAFDVRVVVPSITIQQIGALTDALQDVGVNAEVLRIDMEAVDILKANLYRQCKRGHA